MRITTEKLLSLALKETESREGVLSGYVIGSTATGEPLLGGTCDVDLVLIHKDQPAAAREVVPLSDEVHLDIAHHPRSLYEQPRNLRLEPWMGPAICEPVFLYDPDHFFEWAQASVRGQYHRPHNALARAVAFLRRAQESRQGLETERQWIRCWLRAVLEAANAVASLVGFPAAGRRLAPQLKFKLAEVGHPEVYGHFQRLVGAEHMQEKQASNWVTSWARAFDAASANASEPELAPGRRSYFLRGFQHMVEQGPAVEILWPLLHTWNRSIQSLSLTNDADGHQEHWSQALDTLRLSNDHADERELELEAFLDHVERVLETWAEQVGA